ncbi:MAG: hypothetical protein LBM70_00535 [Victivallales bacterium]|jgi:hypothetical protein|nr:hypothetical protein [Victivallales bacterium]
MNETKKLDYSKYRNTPTAGKNILLIVGAVAAAVRILLFAAYLDSPLRYFHLVPGLDMQSLLRYGQWGENGVQPVFTLHRTLVAIVYYLNGGMHSVLALSVIQLAGGVATAMLSAYAALHLWGNRRLALLTGLIAALYAPAAMYELTMLQESLLLLAFSASFAGLLWAHKHRFACQYGLILGVLLGLASIGRPTALLWVILAIVWSAWVIFRRQKQQVFRVFWIVGGVIAVYLSVSVLNYRYNDRLSPFFSVLDYSASVNKLDENQAKNPALVSAPIQLFKIGLKAVERLPKVFLAHEIPDNLNYYFIRDNFPELKLMIGPGLLIPFALAGLALILISGRFLRRDGVICIAIFALSLPICANYPMGRYRLILLLPFTLAAVETARIALQKPRKLYLPLSLVLLLGAFLVNPFTRAKFYRSSDFVTWALALESQAGGKMTPESISALLEAYQGSNNEKVAMNLLIRLITLGKFSEAQGLINDALERNIGNPSLLHYYSALLHLEARDLKGTQIELSKCDPAALGEFTIKFYFLQGEVARISGRKTEAARLYQKALNEPDAFGFRPQIERALSQLQESHSTRNSVKTKPTTVAPSK